MKRSYLVLLILAVLIAAHGTANSQYIFFPQYLELNTMGGGARAAGMGGAFVGLSEGEMAYSWNPAGMIFDEKHSIGLQFNSANNKFTQYHGVKYTFATETLDIYSVEAEQKHTNLNYTGFNIPFTYFGREWAVGGGYRNVFDMKLEYDTPGIEGSRDIFTASSGVDAVSVAVAGKITENISLGITGNSYIRGSESNMYIGNGYEYQSSPSSPIDTLDLRINSVDHYSGFNFDIGLMGEISMFKGGVVIHSPFDLKQKAKITQYIMIPPTPIGVINRVTYTTDIPLSFSIGLSAKPVEQLIIALDYDSRPMSKSEININLESGSNTTEDPEWEDINQYRLGVEYSLKTEFATIPVRFGFRNNPSLEKELTSWIYNDADSTVDRTYGDQLTSNIITMGTGLHFDRAWIDLAYQFGSSSYNTDITYIGVGSVEQKRDYSRLLVSAGMNF